MFKEADKYEIPRELDIVYIYLVIGNCHLCSCLHI